MITEGSIEDNIVNRPRKLQKHSIIVEKKNHSNPSPLSYKRNTRRQTNQAGRKETIESKLALKLPLVNPRRKTPAIFLSFFLSNPPPTSHPHTQHQITKNRAEPARPQKKGAAPSEKKKKEKLLPRLPPSKQPPNQPINPKHGPPPPGKNGRHASTHAFPFHFISFHRACQTIVNYLGILASTYPENHPQKKS